MSVEELKIRGELEMDVERDLEEEIKDGIYHLALKLHQLYQHKRPKHFDQKDARKYMSEVNINIRMEGGTIIQVKEIKKEGSRINRPTIASATRSQPNVGGYYAATPHQMKFNWEKSLRKESNHSIFIEKIHPKKFVGYVNSSTKHGFAGKSMNAAGLKNEVLKLGWKY